VAAILNESGLSAIEGRQLALARGSVEIDVHAVDADATPPAIYLCECKLWASRVPQSEVHAFRTVVADAGAHFGLFISSAGFQAGAHEVVKLTNVHLVDWAGFENLFVERWCGGYWAPTVRAEARSLVSASEMPRSDAPIRAHHGEPITEAEAVGLFASGMWSPPFTKFGMPEMSSGERIVDAIWREHAKYRSSLPIAVREATELRKMLDAIVAVAREHG